MSDQLVLVEEETFSRGLFGECISFFEHNEIYLLSLSQVKLDHTQAIALNRVGVPVRTGAFVLIELSGRVPDALAAQFQRNFAEVGHIVPPEAVDIFDHLFLL